MFRQSWARRRFTVVMVCFICASILAASAVGSNPQSQTADPGANYQPSGPITAAFLYPWFPNAWDQGTYPYTNFTPSLGLYDSSASETIDAQLRMGADAGLDAFIASWWGPGHHTDKAMPNLLDRTTRAGSPAPNTRWAVYYEEEGQSDPSVAKIVDDLSYLKSNYFDHPGYLRVDGKPVVFVWADGSDGSSMAARWDQAKATFGNDVYVVLKVFSGYRNVVPQPDSWHQYGPAVAYDEQLPYSATVSPGFWLKGQSPRLARDLDRFRADAQRAKDSGAFWQLITSWNEWGEGTSVEPATEFGTQYLDALTSVFGARSTEPPEPTTTVPETTTTAPETTTTVPETTTTAPTNAGTLIVGSPEPGAVVLPPIVLEADADAYVTASTRRRRLGQRSTIQVDASPDKDGYIRFQVPGGMTPTGAVLRLYTPSGNRVGFDVYSVSSNNWDERTITMGNAPEMGEMIASSGPLVAGTWIEVDVSSAVSEAGAVTLGLSSTSTRRISIKSRESSRGPELAMTFEASAPPPAAEQPPGETTTTTAGATTTTTGGATTTTQPTTTQETTTTTQATTTTTKPTTTSTARPTTTTTRPTTTAQPSAAVRFGAVGDFGGMDSRAGSVMRDILGRDLAAFFILGDMSYSEIEPEQAWCDWVHGYLGPDYPMEVVAGNHEEDSRSDGFIRNFASCMPDRLGSDMGPGGYAVNYSTDLGPVTVISVSPGLEIDRIDYRYLSGSAERTWMLNAINAAKSEGDWVVVGMHKNCITMGEKSCEIGREFMQLLIDRGVDLVLQGHEHSYERSHSLSRVVQNGLGDIADDGADGVYSRGAGTVIVITGTAGRSMRDCSHGDSEAGNFVRHWCGEEATDTKGYMLLSVNNNRLSAEFIRTAGTSFQDSFVIQ